MTEITKTFQTKVKVELKEEMKDVMTIKQEKEDVFERDFLMDIASTSTPRN